MKPITLRLDEDEIDALDAEAEERGYSSRTDYIRYIVRNREQLFDDAPPDVEERLSELEDEVAELREQLES